MAIAVVQHVGVQGNNVATITTGTITTTSGNGIVRTDAYASAAFSSVTDSKSNAWTQIGTEQANNPATASVRQYYNLNIAGGSAHTFTLTLAAAGYPSIGVTEFSGQDTAGFDKTAQGDDGVTAVTAHASPNTPTTTLAREILFGSYADAGGSGLAVSGSFTLGYVQDASATAQSIGHEYQIVVATGAYASSFSTPTAQDGANLIGTYKAAIVEEEYWNQPPPQEPDTNVTVFG